MSLFVFFISVLIVAQHVLGNHQEQTTADVIASCWYVPWLQGGCQDRLAGSASMDGFISQLALLARGWGGHPPHPRANRNYDAQSTTHQIYRKLRQKMLAGDLHYLIGPLLEGYFTVVSITQPNWVR